MTKGKHTTFGGILIVIAMRLLHGCIATAIDAVVGGRWWCSGAQHCLLIRLLDVSSRCNESVQTHVLC